MSGLFLNPLIANNEHSFLNRGNLLRHIKVQLSHKLKIFCDFFLHFLNSDSIYKIFRKKITLLSDVFMNLQTPKNVVR